MGEASFAFGSRRISDIEARRFTMPPEEILLLNPNTRTAPLFRSRRDAEITLEIYRGASVLWRETPYSNPWGVSFMRMFDMANDADLFYGRAELEADGWILQGNLFVKNDSAMLPLYEAKMVRHYDHRLGTYEGQSEAQANMGTLPRLTAEQKGDPHCSTLPRYWVDSETVYKRIGDRWHGKWLLGWRDIARSTDERTMICTLLPLVGFILDSFRAFQRNDPERFARTKKMILEVYDAMALAMETRQSYKTILDPPPGKGPRHPDTRGRPVL